MSEFVLGMRMPLMAVFSPASATRAATAVVHFASRSRIGNPALLLASCRSMRRVRPGCTIHCAVGCAVAPGTRMRLVACARTAKTYSRAPAGVRTSRRARAGGASARLRGKSARIVLCRSGPGGMPYSWRIFPTGQAATLMPGAAGSPWIRWCSHELSSRTGRDTGARIERTAGGRPRRFGAQGAAWLRVNRSRCRREIVSGRAGGGRGRGCFLGRWRSGPAGITRSVSVHVGLPTWRCGTDSGWCVRGEDLDVLVPVAHRRQTWQGEDEGVGGGEVGRAQRHERG